MTEDLTRTRASQLDAVERGLTITQQDDATATVVSELSQVYATTVADLWEAVTSPDRLPRWFAPVSGELELGGRYQVEGNAGGTIEVCEPPRTFRVTWEFAGNVSWVTVRVEQAGDDGARLTLEHTATEAFPNDFWATYGPGATGVGWDLAFLGLALHIATGADKPAESELEQDEQTREFIAGSSRRWADTSVAAGTAEEAARAAERATTAFYTGQEA